MAFYDIIETTGKVIDVVGVAVIVGGTVIALAATVVRVRGTEGESAGGAYDAFRRRLGRSILLGLEFLVAADIIRTVAVTPTAQSVAVLAGIVAIRTFLSFSLQVEMTGSWPWQRPAKPVDAPQPK
ncbi:DUF1622 domain-containing protein [Mycolicibacterium sp. HS_4_1]